MIDLYLHVTLLVWQVGRQVFCIHLVEHRSTLLMFSLFFREGTLKIITFVNDNKQHVSNVRALSLELKYCSSQDIEEYVRGPSQYPLVIHGKSGCGKTAVIALAAKAISESMDKKCCVCLRYVCLTDWFSCG